MEGFMFMAPWMYPADEDIAAANIRYSQQTIQSWKIGPITAYPFPMLKGRNRFLGDGAGRISVCAKGNCDITVAISEGKELAKLKIDSTEYKTYSALIPKTKGVNPLWLIFNGEASVAYMEFFKDNG